MEWRTLALCTLVLALTWGLHVNAIRARRSNHVDNVCSMWGNFHFKTFDGDVYQFQGICEYNLVSDCHGPVPSFSVHVKRAQLPRNPQITRVLVTIGDVAIDITSNLVMVNGDIVELPHYEAGVLVEQSAVYLKLFAKLGLSILWNRDDAIMVELDTKYANQTCGLCGDFNGIPIYNEFLSEAREIGPIEFGNKYRVHSPNDNCEDPYEEDESAQTTVDKCQAFRAGCSELLENEAWSSCTKILSPEPYIRACMVDRCWSRPGDIVDTVPLCTTLSEYSRQCSHAGGTPPNWRKPKLCEVKCPFNMEYSESGSPCVDTCTHRDTSLLCEEHKMDGCFCPPGTVFDDISKRGCIPQKQCQCKHNQVYNPGDMLLRDDKECVCQQGDWVCEILPTPGACAVEEGSHFTTFDGKEFTFHGDCYYIISKDCEESRFVVLGQLIPCVNRETDTCLKSIALLLNNDKNNALIIKDDGTVRHTGDLTLPYTTANLTVFRPSSFHIMLQTSFGLQMQVQLVPLMQLYITLDHSFQTKTCGLCGNFNMVLSDELKTPQGLVEGTAASFASSWKAQYNCPDRSERLDDPCSYSIDSESYAEHWCTKLKEKGGPFATCHSAVNPEGYYKRCKYSSCTCEKSENCLCAVFSSYVRACTAKGIFMKGWRDTVCGKYTEHCPATQTFSYLLQGCQRTCHSLSLERQGCSTDFVPVDGCACPDGLYENEKGVCVSMDKCSCYHNGERIKPGKSINIRNEHCLCTNGKLSCHAWKALVTDCPAPKVYFNCSEAGPDEHGLECAKTCSSKTIDCYLAGCASGCQCPPGLIDDGRGHCVQENKCPCKHNGHFYADGSKIPDECNTCTCTQGKWVCTEKKCPGSCTIYGSGHYNTFDKQTFGFSGDCDYIAVQNKCGNKTGTFHVITENVPCGTTGTTCSKYVRILLGRIEFYLVDGKIEERWLDSGPSIHYTKRIVGLYMVIESDIGLTVFWDRKTTVRIMLQPQHMGEVCGLCGNYNGNGKDDFTTQGQLQVSNILEFVNSWKVKSDCPDAKPDFDPCFQTPNRHTWAKMQCSIITGNTFKDCHKKVDPKPYYDNCVKDSCACDTGGDCECFCTAVAAYAQACNEAGVCVAWRTPEICPVFCDYYNAPDECTWHYSPCHTPCYKTCLNLEGVCLNPLPNLEGCYPVCPEDKPIFDEWNQICVEECDNATTTTPYTTTTQITTTESTTSVSTPEPTTTPSTPYTTTKQITTTEITTSVSTPEPTTTPSTPYTTTTQITTTESTASVSTTKPTTTPSTPYTTTTQIKTTESTASVSTPKPTTTPSTPYTTTTQITTTESTASVSTPKPTTIPSTPYTTTTQITTTESTASVSTPKPTTTPSTPYTTTTQITTTESTASVSTPKPTTTPSTPYTTTTQITTTESTASVSTPKPTTTPSTPYTTTKQITTTESTASVSTPKLTTTPSTPYTTTTQITTTESTASVSTPKPTTTPSTPYTTTTQITTTESTASVSTPEPTTTPSTPYTTTTQITTTESTASVSTPKPTTTPSTPYTTSTQITTTESTASVSTPKPTTIPSTPYTTTTQITTTESTASVSTPKPTTTPSTPYTTTTQITTTESTASVSTPKLTTTPSTPYTTTTQITTTESTASVSTPKPTTSPSTPYTTTKQITTTESTASVSTPKLTTTPSTPYTTTTQITTTESTASVSTPKPTTSPSTPYTTTKQITTTESTASVSTPKPTTTPSTPYTTTTQITTTESTASVSTPKLTTTPSTPYTTTTLITTTESTASVSTPKPTTTPSTPYTTTTQITTTESTASVSTPKPTTIPSTPYTTTTQITTTESTASVSTPKPTTTPSTPYTTTTQITTTESTASVSTPKPTTTPSTPYTTTKQITTTESTASVSTPKLTTTPSTPYTTTTLITTTESTASVSTPKPTTTPSTPYTTTKQITTTESTASVSTPKLTTTPSTPYTTTTLITTTESTASISTPKPTTTPSTPYTTTKQITTTESTASVSTPKLTTTPSTPYTTTTLITTTEGTTSLNTTSPLVVTRGTTVAKSAAVKTTETSTTSSTSKTTTETQITTESTASVSTPKLTTTPSTPYTTTTQITTTESTASVSTPKPTTTPSTPYTTTTQITTTESTASVSTPKPTTTPSTPYTTTTQITTTESTASVSTPKPTTTPSTPYTTTTQITTTESTASVSTPKPTTTPSTPYTTTKQITTTESTASVSTPKPTTTPSTPYTTTTQITTTESTASVSTPKLTTTPSTPYTTTTQITTTESTASVSTPKPTTTPSTPYTTTTQITTTESTASVSTTKPTTTPSTPYTTTTQITTTESTASVSTPKPTTTPSTPYTTTTQITTTESTASTREATTTPSTLYTTTTQITTTEGTTSVTTPEPTTTASTPYTTTTQITTTESTASTPEPTTTPLTPYTTTTQITTEGTTSITTPEPTTTPSTSYTTTTQITTTESTASTPEPTTTPSTPYRTTPQITTTEGTTSVSTPEPTTTPSTPYTTTTQITTSESTTSVTTPEPTTTPSTPYTTTTQITTESTASTPELTTTPSTPYITTTQITTTEGTTSITIPEPTTTPLTPYTTTTQITTEGTTSITTPEPTTTPSTPYTTTTQITTSESTTSVTTPEPTTTPSTPYTTTTQITTESTASTPELTTTPSTPYITTTQITTTEGTTSITIPEPTTTPLTPYTTTTQITTEGTTSITTPEPTTTPSTPYTTTTQITTESTASTPEPTTTPSTPYRTTTQITTTESITSVSTPEPTTTPSTPYTTTTQITTTESTASTPEPTTTPSTPYRTTTQITTTEGTTSVSTPEPTTTPSTPYTTTTQITTTQSTASVSTPEQTTSTSTTTTEKSTTSSTSTTTIPATTTTTPATTTTTPTTASTPTLTTPKHGCPTWDVGTNETFEICNCTLARCIEDNIIEIIPYECPPLQNITCSNRRNPVEGFDEYQCCKEYVCDCFCEGWGDPHYITFDGLFYSHQGNCTYVLMEEIRPKHNLKIYIDNVNCDPREHVSCPRALIVSYNKLIITLKNNNLIGAAKLQALKGNVVLPLPFVQNGVRVLGSGVNLILEIPQLGVVVTFGVTGFSVFLPFQHFGKNTQGHCGTCNNNQADDCMLPDGKLVNDCAVMADYWPAKDLYDVDCPAPTSIPTAKPCPINPVCDLLNTDVFKKCHPYVSPDNYFKGCQFDSCHMTNPAAVCTSLQTYALACSQFGICLHWRNYTDLCTVECLGDKVYKPCGPAEPPTCEDRPNEHTLNVTIEGCFCPDGTLLFNKDSGLCVDKCGCLDASGQAREPGEKFQLGCQDCLCDASTTSVICKPKQCSNNNQITCSEPGFIVVNETDPSDKCCTILACRCDSNSCPSVDGKCNIGYAPVLQVPEGQCCPKLTCEPKKVCVHKNIEYEPGTSVPVVDCQECQCTWDVDPKTQLFLIRCGFVTCDETCEPGYEYVETVSDECCGKCVQSKCILNLNGTRHLLQSGAEWAPSKYTCERYTCTNIGGEFVTTHYKIQCPPFNIDNCQPGTVQLSADDCCQVCVEKEKGCKVETISDYILHDSCQSENQVEQTHCAGDCNSYSKYSQLGSSSCSCCQAARSSNRTVTLKCLNGDVVPHSYVYVEECNCSQTKCLH
ncbi:mucin-2 isoform X3 [Pygocentrus nattereri]|uniref:mucin-2 isoform X3 n=1 Tax=Pygocentrus nattereri TaxID=42514 RepID=UPI001890E128|nr:mucin-2 isoform X3 [Pygocentrus nattereri]